MGGFANNAPIVTDGLVFYVDAGNSSSYPGSGSTWSDLVGGNDGAFINGPTFNSGNAGSIVFDGTNDYVRYSNCPEYDFANANFSAGCFFKSSESANYTGLAGKINLANGTGGWAFEFHQGKITSWINNNLLSSPLAYNDNNWHHAFITHGDPSTGTRKIYIDGYEVASGTMPQHSYTFSNIDLWVGGWTGGGSYTFNGSIAQLQLYSKQLSSSEILQNYNALKNRFV
jgi:hypothetical protein